MEFKDNNIDDLHKFEIEKLPQNERELIIESLNGITHTSGLLDIFIDVAWDGNELYLTCTECEREN